jgi:hypothetical protein
MIENLGNEKREGEKEKRCSIPSCTRTTVVVLPSHFLGVQGGEAKGKGWGFSLVVFLTKGCVRGCLIL